MAKKKVVPKKRRGVKLKPTDLHAKDLRVESPSAKIAELVSQIEGDGGHVLSVYREPLGGNTQIFAALPIHLIEPTPFQRDVSDAHVRKLTFAMDKTRRYLDPIIVTRMESQAEEKYFTPNGNHRLTALKELDAKTILALVVAEPEVAYHILALNIEKAHNLREKAIEVARMYQELSELAPTSKESDYQLEFDEPQLITLGFAYQARPRISGGAYQPALKKVDGFFSKSLKVALQERKARTDLVLKLDDAVSEAVQKLKDRGMVSPYLKSFVVSRINPLRFIKGDLPSFEDLMETMTKRARGMKIDKIKTEDLSRSGGIPDEE
jgi:ParB family chromosome partitioning protein